MRVLGAIGLLVGSVTAQAPIDCSSDVDGSGRVGVDDVSTAPCLFPPRSALRPMGKKKRQLPWLAVPPNVQRLFRAAAQASARVWQMLIAVLTQSSQDFVC